MPFLLMFWKPLAGILLIVALAAGALFAKHRYDEGLREEGRAEVRAEWAADKAKIAADLMRRSENAEREKQEAERKAVIAERARVARFATLKARADAEAAAAPVRVTPAYVGLLHDARIAAEASRPAGQVAEAAPAPSESAQAYGVAMLAWAALALERDGLWSEYVDTIRRACTPQGADP